MSFSYNDYQFHCLILPASILLFSAVVFIAASIWSIRDIVRKGPTAEKVLTLLFFLFIAGAFIRIDGGRLLNGGLYLLREKAAEAVTYEGIIEEISLYEQTQSPIFLPNTVNTETKTGKMATVMKSLWTKEPLKRPKSVR